MLSTGPITSRKNATRKNQAVAQAADTDVKLLGAEQAVLATYRRMEAADRKGDGELWFALRDRKTLDAISEP